MYAVGGSQAISRERNPWFSPAFKHSDAEFVKNREYLNPDLNENQQDQASSGLSRYRSAPSSFFSCLMDGGGIGGGSGVFEDLLNVPGDAEPYDLQYPAAVKQEIHDQKQYSTSAATQMVYQASVDHHDLLNRSNSLSANTNPDGLYKVADSTAMEKQVQGKMGGGNCSNLARQSSSPAGFFSNLTENGFAVMNDVGNFRVGNGINGKGSPTSGLNDHMNFSSGQSSSSKFMPQIAENGNESNKPENGHLGYGNSGNGYYVPNFQNDVWSDSSLNGLKRTRDDEEKLSGFSVMESQNGDTRSYRSRLTHHLSLPKTSAEMGSIEKYLQFQQDAVPCKIRAKRGCATHPRSIAERMRRTRISDRMKKLQDLFPNMDKQTNTADMLDLAVEYIKDLQNQVQTLTDKRGKCTCSK